MKVRFPFGEVEATPEELIDFVRRLTDAAPELLGLPARPRPTEVRVDLPPLPPPSGKPLDRWFPTEVCIYSAPMPRGFAPNSTTSEITETKAR